MEPPLRALIEQAEFKESFRGYDRAQVDDALEQLASRAGKLETELTKALDRLATAESRARAEAEAEVEARIQAEVEAHMAAAEQPAPHEQENAEQVRLTIVMAQRTADAAIGEARAEAERLVAQAREEADRTVAGARADSARERDEARQRLLSEITELESVRDLLRQDAEVFEHHVGRQREQLSGVIEQLRRVLDDPDGLRAAPPPPKSEFTIPGGDEPAQLPLGVAEEGSSTDPPSEPSTDPWVAEPVEPEPAGGDSGDDAPSGDEPAGGGPAVAVDIEAEPLPVAAPAVASSPGRPGGGFDIEAAVDHAAPGAVACRASPVDRAVRRRSWPCATRPRTRLPHKPARPARPSAH